jgi:hypothetical protein
MFFPTGASENEKLTKPVNRPIITYRTVLLTILGVGWVLLAQKELSGTQSDFLDRTVRVLYSAATPRGEWTLGVWL